MGLCYPLGNPLTCALLQDLEYLSEGLEGRSQSPVALLFDALLRPDTDFGGSLDSVLSWKRQKDRAVPHLVLGRNLPGGAWHVSVVLEQPCSPSLTPGEGRGAAVLAGPDNNFLCSPLKAPW